MGRISKKKQMNRPGEEKGGEKKEPNEKQDIDNDDAISWLRENSTLFIYSLSILPLQLSGGSNSCENRDVHELADSS